MSVSQAARVPALTALRLPAGAPALACAATCIALVVAQYLWPAWPGFHRWQYAAALALSAIPVARYALAAVRGPNLAGARLAVSMAGALIIAMAGIASGLLGPDTQTIVRPPGTVAPLPDVGAAAFFPNVDAAAVARADAHIVLRRKNAPYIDVGPGQRRYLGASALTLDLQTAAYITGYSVRGEHLTITQPASAAFLSPVLLFPQHVTIAGQVLPADTFAAPAAHRQIKAFYFSQAAVLQHSHGARGRESILFAVDDESGRPVSGGIGFAESGRQVELGGVRLQATLGRYPALNVAAVPYPTAMWLGGLLFLGGFASTLGGRIRSVRA